MALPDSSESDNSHLPNKPQSSSKRSNTTRTSEGQGTNLNPGQSERTKTSENPYLTCRAYKVSGNGSDSLNPPNEQWSVKSHAINPLISVEAVEELTAEIHSLNRKADQVNDGCRSISQSLVQLNILVDTPASTNSASHRYQDIPYRPAEFTTKSSADYVPEPQGELVKPPADTVVRDETWNHSNLDELPNISLLQKEASAKHASTFTALLTQYLPASLLTPHNAHPSSPTPPSLLTLETRRAIATARINTILNHIPSAPDRDTFLKKLKESEETCFGHGSEIARVMHELCLRSVDSLSEREEMERKWIEKGRRREGRVMKGLVKEKEMRAGNDWE